MRLRLLFFARLHFAIVDAHALHRIGDPELGDLVVRVGVRAAHRDAGWLHPEN